MNSFYNTITKNENVLLAGKKTIKVNVNVNNDTNLINDSLDSENNIQTEEQIKEKLAEADAKYEEIIESANEQGQQIIEESKGKASDIEKKAYEQGYSQGTQNGYEDGYKQAYEENIERAKIESQEIIDNANSILFEAKEYVTDYMKQHKEEIIKLSVSIAEQVLREQFKDTSSMEQLLQNIINEYELKENFVIKINPLYKESLDKQILELKENYKLSGDVFVIVDELIEEGNAVIDTVNGRLVVGIDAVLEKIKEELL